MIIGQDFLSELQLDLCFLDYTIRLNGGTYEGCTASMRDMNNNYVRINSDLIDDASFRDEELWESEHLLDSTRRTRRIWDAKYQESDLSKVVSNSKHLRSDEQSIL